MANMNDQTVEDYVRLYDKQRSVACDVLAESVVHLIQEVTRTAPTEELRTQLHTLLRNHGY